jgi:hypothetical protein
MLHGVQSQFLRALFGAPATLADYKCDLTVFVFKERQLRIVVTLHTEIRFRQFTKR